MSQRTPSAPSSAKQNQGESCFFKDVFIRERETDRAYEQEEQREVGGGDPKETPLRAQSPTQLYSLTLRSRPDLKPRVRGPTQVP